MRTEVCGVCGQTAQVVRRNYEFREMGIPVELVRIQVIECSHCGNADPIIPNLDGLMHTIASAVVCHPFRLTGGEVRFLRKFVNKSAVEFSRYLDLDPTSLSRIENDRTPIGNGTDKLIRLVVVNMDQRLSEDIKQLMELMPNINDACTQDRPGIHIDPSLLDIQPV